MILQETNRSLVIWLGRILAWRALPRWRIEGSRRHEFDLSANRTEYRAVKSQQPNLGVCIRMNMTGVLGIDSYLGYQLTSRGNDPSNRVASL